ncbi:MAG: amidohydrolase [Clostridia bacterium]|nr:amidohydrolase [Clostridia bacterium]
MKNLITSKAKEIENKLITHRRYLHENAELGFQTVNTSKYILETLSALGAECSLFSQNMVAGTIKGKNNGKTLLLRADIDALAISEQTQLEYSCKNGNMHACGHDMHASMLLGAIEILHGMRESIFGNVKFLFQSAEETLSGARCAINDGILDGVDMAMTVHVMVNSEVPTGSVILSFDSPSAPSADFFVIEITGKGCHGSSPSIGVDPITCACRIVESLEHIRAYETGIHEKAVITIGTISGGENANAIPDKVKLSGTMRCFDEDTRLFCKARFEEIAKGIALAFRCKCEIKYTSECPALINNTQMLEKTVGNLEALLGEKNVIRIKDTRSKIQGSEDFAYFSHAVPSVTVAIAAGSIDKGYVYPLHNPNVIFDEKALNIGCEVLAYNAIKLLEEY